MAVLTMGNTNKDGDTTDKPLLYDFLGMTCSSSDSLPMVLPPANHHHHKTSGGEASASASASASLGGGGGGGVSSGGAHAPLSATSDLGSERQMGNHFEGIPVHGLRGEFSGNEISNRYTGRKRNNSDSLLMGWPRDRIPQFGPESLENSHLMKLFRSSVGGERPRRSHDEELFFGMQPPKPASTSQILQPPVGNRPDSVASKWEHSVLMNAGPSTQYPPRLGQFATNVDKVSSNRYRDSNAGPSIISQPAADEGSRTGIKGSGLFSGVNASSGASERNSSVVLLSGSRLKSGAQSANPESSNPPSRHGSTSSSQQMTIFYAGQAHVFDEVHPNKADVILALAGSNGGSWSTTYSPQSIVQPPLCEASLPNEEKGIGISSLAVPEELRGRLSIPSNSSYGFNQGGQNSTTRSDPLNTSFGEHQGSMKMRHARPMTQVVDPNTEGSRDR